MARRPRKPNYAALRAQERREHAAPKPSSTEPFDGPTELHRQIAYQRRVVAWMERAAATPAGKDRAEAVERERAKLRALEEELASAGRGSEVG